MLIIGIGGGTGSGKTTVVNQIISEFPKGEVQVISQDSYYKDTSHLSFEDRCKINFDHPQSIDFQLLETHLKDLKKGKSINQPVYSFKTHNRTGDTTLTRYDWPCSVDLFFPFQKPWLLRRWGRYFY